MITKHKVTLENLLNKQISLADEKEISPRIDAATILADLSNANELKDAQASLELLKTAVASGNKEELSKILATHIALLDSLSIRLLSDAGACKSEKLTITILELFLKTSETTRKTIQAASELATNPTPMVAIQVNNA